MVFPQDIILDSIVLEEFKDTKGAIRIHKWRKDRQHNSQKKNRTKEQKQSTKDTHKTIERLIDIIFQDH
jgi:hypothetical protein